MTVSRINDDGIGTGIHQRLHAFQRIDSHAHAGSHAQPTFLVLTGHGLVLGLRDVLVCNQSHQVVVLVHHGELLYLVLLQYLSRCSQVCLLVCRHQVLARHHVVNLVVQPTFKTKVTVGHDAHQMVLVVHHGNTADVVLSHHRQRLGHCRTAPDGHRIVDHSVLSTFHDSDFASLRLYRHILVHHADAAFTRNGNRHGRFRHGVHGSRHKRNIQLDVLRETGFQLYRLGQYFRISGD